MNFSSENFDGVHPFFMAALARANQDFEPSYGNDHYTTEAVNLLKQEFGNDIEVRFTFNGTGANNFALSCLAERHHAILCSDIAHCYVDEATAPEAFIGCRLYPVPSENGKITIEALHKYYKRKGDIHHPQISVITLTQPTEYGTVYSVEELREIKAFCKANELLLHVDGARFFNAAAALNVPLSVLSTDIGIDALTLGGTKTGMMFGEAVIFFRPPGDNAFRFMHKRSMQLTSKNRFIAVQFKTVIEHRLWEKLASYINELALFFEKEIQSVPQVKIAYPVQTNVVFLHMSEPLYLKMQQHAGFYYWDKNQEIARIVFSFNNTRDEVLHFIEMLKECFRGVGF